MKTLITFLFVMMSSTAAVAGDVGNPTQVKCTSFYNVDGKFEPGPTLSMDIQDDRMKVISDGPRGSIGFICHATSCTMFSGVNGEDEEGELLVWTEVPRDSRIPIQSSVTLPKALWFTPKAGPAGAIVRNISTVCQML
jgi:hypothetical protein